MIRKLIPALLTATIALTAQECDEGGKANKASYARDGVTMFGDDTNRACGGNTKWCAQQSNGKLKFGKTYRPHPPEGKLKMCDWSLYVVRADGKTEQKGSGGWPAKLYVARPDTVHVFLRSQDCGEWR